jgi:hypothetical protein
MSITTHRPLVHHPVGGYAFLPGIAPYSCGVVALEGFEIVHVTLRHAVQWRDGLQKVARYLEALNRPRAALCAVELRSPAPFSFGGFDSFNTDYASVLADWGLFVEGVNPVARTNVAPIISPPESSALYAFSYTRRSMIRRPTFVVAGAGELPEGVLEPEAIVAAGDTTALGIAQKAAFVMGLMTGRLAGLGAEWRHVSAVDVYTIHPFDRVFPEVILKELGEAAAHGVRWYFSRPPIIGIEFEMDLRGVHREEWLDPDGSA